AAVDGTPPSAPSSLNATAASGRQVDLAWAAATDNLGVTGYDIYRGGLQLGWVAGATLSYSDTTVSPATQYSYTVQARDAAGNLSANSNTATVNTPAAGDTTAPTAPTNPRTVAVSSSQVDLAWSAASDNVGVTGYDVYRGT